MAGNDAFETVSEMKAAVRIPDRKSQLQDGAGCGSS